MVAGVGDLPALRAAHHPPTPAAVMSRPALAALCLGVGFIASDVVKIAIALSLAKWGHRHLRADQLP